MANEEFQQIRLPVRTDRPWILCFIPLSLRWIGRLAQKACYYGLVLLLTGTPGVVQPPDSNAPTVVYSTVLGEHKPVTLSDGSKVELNSDSSISVTFSPLARLVELTRGEALFDVNHENTRPFRVKSGRSIIEDIGTAFDV
jgi:transmembrane sensor